MKKKRGGDEFREVGSSQTLRGLCEGGWNSKCGVVLSWGGKASYVHSEMGSLATVGRI